jgi:hypothetical protein
MAVIAKIEKLTGPGLRIVSARLHSLFTIYAD